MYCDECMQVCPRCEGTYQELHAERDRLREALNLILAVSDDDPILKTAREALAGRGKVCQRCHGARFVYAPGEGTADCPCTSPPISTTLTETNASQEKGK